MNTDQHHQVFRLVRRGLVVAFYIGCAGIVASALGSIVLFLLFPFGFDSGAATPDPPDDFKQLTGWILPSDAQVFHAENTFSGFKGDGDYTLVVRTTADHVRKCLSTSDADSWKPCPIPSELREYCWRLPKHNGSLYRAEKVMATDDDWHRGSLVIVNPETGMIWVYAWKI